MRGPLTLAAGGVLLSVALAGCAPDVPPPPPGVSAAPTLGDRWLVINYWAIWCAPCREEIPELNTLAHRGMVRVYAVNFDDVQGEELRRQAAELGIQFPLLSADPGPALGIARPTVLPTTLILSPAGKLATRLLGPQTVESIEREVAVARRDASNPPRSDAGEGLLPVKR